MNLTPFWSDQRIAELKRRWNAGQSSGVIAADWKVTRNTIAGQVHRLGLKRGLAAKPSVQTLYPKRVHRIKHPVKTLRRPLMAEVSKSGTDGHLVSLMALGPSMCRFPIGDPADPEFGFCGAPTYPGDSYCENCKSVVFAPVPKRSRRAA